MKPKTLLFAALVLACAPAHATPAPDAPAADPKAAPSSPFNGADQKLVDDYTAALSAKYGFSAAAIEEGKLAVTPAGGEKTLVDVKDARSEDDVEARLLDVLKPAKLEAGEKKTPVYIVGASADDLFKGAVAGGEKDGEGDAAAKADANDYKALLDLKQGRISFPTHTAAWVDFNAAEQPARRVFLRRGDDGTLLATFDGAGYGYATARVLKGEGKGQLDASKTGAASAFFAMNAFMQKQQKAAEAEAAREAKMKYPKLTDAGYRHPAFEKLMAQVQGNLSAESLDKGFDASGGHAPADLQAKAQAAKELAASGYGAGAHWKINSNGKYAAPDGTMTLLVRPNGASGHDGKIDEVAVTVTKDAKGQWDLKGAADKVTDVLLHGSVAQARAEALKQAATPSVAEAVVEAERKPAQAVSGVGTLGFVAPAVKDAKPDAVPDPVIDRTNDRLGGQERVQAGPVPAPVPEAAPQAAPLVAKPGRAPCVVPQGTTVIAEQIKSRVDGPVPDWMADKAGFSTDGTTASAIACSQSNLKTLREVESEAKTFALMRIQVMQSCPSVSKPARIVGSGPVPFKGGKRASACARAAVEIDG